jgi:tRNA dimethylallyltransferase
VNKTLSPATLILCGPTAAGKTDAALALARQLPIEIISMDSALVYRQMQIGTAKPSQAELAQVPHHLIDVIDPTDSYSAAQFTQSALALIQQIRAREKYPVIVGGTMLYAKALTEGLSDLPTADPILRAELAQEAQQIGWPAMHAKLAEKDPETAARLKPNDSQRIQRALEVIALTQQKLSSLQTRPTRQISDHFLYISLEPSDRAVLHRRIAQRYDAMLDRGLVAEVEQLRARGDLHPDLPSMRCVGYRQTWEFLDGQIDYKTMREHGIIATRQLAKRQLTWLRAIPERHVIDCLQADAPASVWATLSRLIK